MCRREQCVHPHRALVHWISVGKKSVERADAPLGKVSGRFENTLVLEEMIVLDKRSALRADCRCTFVEKRFSREEKR